MFNNGTTLISGRLVVGDMNVPYEPCAQRGVVGSRVGPSGVEARVDGVLQLGPAQGVTEFGDPPRGWVGK